MRSIGKIKEEKKKKGFAIRGTRVRKRDEKVVPRARKKREKLCKY